MSYIIENGELSKDCGKGGLKPVRIAICQDEAEMAAVRCFRDKYFFAPIGIEDPYQWTFDHASHAHLVLYQGTEIIGYAHIQLWPDHRAAMRIIVVDEDKRNQNSGSCFLNLCEEWLRTLGVKSIHAESRQASLRFYIKNSYTEAPFNDPDGYESDPNDIPVGKML